MKVKEFLAEIDKLKKANKITDESEVLTFVDEFMELCPYEGNTVALTTLSSNSFLKEELDEKIERKQRRYDELKQHIEDPTFFDEEERDLAELDLSNKAKDLKKLKALEKKYNTTWKNALVV